MAISEPGNLPAPSRVEPGSASGKVESIVGARRLLTINTGSSSLKAALYRLWENTTETPEIRAEASRIGGRGGGLRLADARSETLEECWDDLPDHIAALDDLLSRLRDRGLDRDDLAAVGHRIVHGGDRHREPPRVAPELVADLRALVPIDPNHLPSQSRRSRPWAGPTLRSRRWFASTPHSTAGCPASPDSTRFRVGSRRRASSATASTVSPTST